MAPYARTAPCRPAFRLPAFPPPVSLRCLAALAMACLLAFASPPLRPAKAQEPQRVAVQFHWLEQFEHAGFYMAREKGFYAEAGLDVDFLPFEKDRTSVVDSVLSGRAQYGVGYSSLIHDFHQDRPVVALAAIFQDSPLVLLSLADKGIDTVPDLKGRRVMMGGDALNAAPVMALLFSQGLVRSDILPQAHSSDIEDLVSGRTDAMSAYISNEPFRLRERGIPYRVFDPKDAGLSFYGNILFSSQQEVRNHPERTRAFVEATLKGWRYAFRNIEESVDVIHDRYNEQGKSREALLYEAEALRDLAVQEGIPVGHVDITKLEKISDAYRLMGIAMSPRPLRDFLWEHVRRGPGRPLDFTPTERAFIENIVVKAGTTTNWAPFAFTDPATDLPSGIGHDFWKLIVESAGLKSRTTAYDSFVHELQSIRSKDLDVIYSVGRTAEREAFARFSQPYATFPIAIATSKEENFLPNANALAGKRIAVGRNFTAHRMMARVHPDLDYLPVSNVKEGLQAVSSGHAFAFVDIMPVLAHAIDRHGFTNLKISGNTGLVFDLRIMVRDDYPELVSIANKVIAAIPAEKSQEILNRWINVTYEQSLDITGYLPYLAAALLVLLLAFSWLFHAKQQAQRANRAKSEFLALMSHDLRTPLNAIMGFADVIRAETFGPIGNPRYRQYVDDIHKSGQLLVNLINDLLDLSRIEAGKYEIEDEEIDLHELVASVHNQCTVLAQDRRITLDNIVPERFPILLGDRRMLTQVLNNLVSNAIKFSNEGGRIETAAGLGGRDRITLQVTDEGIGMSKEELEQVIKPFERANRAEVRRAEGTGLGLFLCQSMMRLLDGDLSIRSARGKGTTVTLSFPPQRTLPRERDVRPAAAQ